MSGLPARPSLEHVRGQAKARQREREIALSQARHELAGEYGFGRWSKLVHAIQANQLHGIERALVLADRPALAAVLEADKASATAEIAGLPPLLVLLRRSLGSPADVRDCTQLLLDAGADPDSNTLEWSGEGHASALFAAVERRDLPLVRLLLDAGATSDEDAFYHACEQSDTVLLDALHGPGFEDLVNHKLDFEDLIGLRWFLDHGVDVNTHRCLHHAISRGRGVLILTALIEAGADVNPAVGSVGCRPPSARPCRSLRASRRVRTARQPRRHRRAGPRGRRGARGRARRIGPPAERPGTGAGQPGR
jgi:hypothetical protein